MRGCLMVSALISGSSGQGSSPAARFSKAPKTFRARKAICSSSVSKTGEVYTPETSCVKRTCVYIKNTSKHKLRDFATAFRVRKLFGTFEKRAPGRDMVLYSWAKHFTLIVLPSTQVYKWVPANLMLGVTLRWTSIPSRGE